MAFIVAVGVLVDTIIARSLLVPALSYDIGRAVWWPSRLSRSEREKLDGGAHAAEPSAAEPGPGSATEDSPADDSPVENPRHRA